MAKVTVINQEREAIMLDDGTQIGAAYTPEARREVELSDDDRRRYVETGRLAVVEHVTEKVVVNIPATPLPPAEGASTANKSERRADK